MNLNLHTFFFPLLCCLLFSFSAVAAEPTSSSDIAALNAASIIVKSDNNSVANSFGSQEEETSESEKILVVLMDSYGIQNYSKIVITDVDMELSILIAKDLFNKLPGGVYTIIASSANDLISQKLIIQ